MSKQYKRLLLKLSGESLMGDQQFGIAPDQLSFYADEIKSLTDRNFEVAVVLGGGNIYRGLQGAAQGMDRVQGDYMGMLATIINSMALNSTLNEMGIGTVLLSGIPIDGICDKATRGRAKQALAEGKVVILSGGTGNPYFTTDTAAALRAAEINADAILKGTRVDGVYTDDPEINPDAKRYDQLGFDEAIEKGLKILDITAFTMCRENNIPIIVFNINEKGNLLKIVEGQAVGTIVG